MGLVLLGNNDDISDFGIMFNGLCPFKERGIEELSIGCPVGGYSHIGVKWLPVRQPNCILAGTGSELTRLPVLFPACIRMRSFSATTNPLVQRILAGTNEDQT